MKYIQLKYQGTGRRTENLRVHGFMGPSRSPMGKGPLKVADDYLRPGTLTTAFQLEVTPNGECQAVDCQHNREVLRRVTKSRKMWEEVKEFDEPSGKYVTVRKEIEHPPAFIVLDGTPIEEDIVSDVVLNESAEVKKLKAEIKKLNAEKGAPDKIEPDKPEANATPSGEVSIPMEEDEPEQLTAEQLKTKRFKNKIADPVSLV